ncbi:MAG: glycosyltransferase, partial [Saprospiraceae bacterium]|nr:glycosyltransferase [Saprospiraceae bacterium]
MLFIKILAYLCFLIYTGSLIYVALFCVSQFHLLYHYIKKNNKSLLLPASDKALPKVTVQLPIFNEKYVVERLIDAIVALDYPKEKLEIQILDDSTDETLELSQAKTAFYQNQGYDIKVIRRSDRSGFKAGALKEAMKTATGEFVAIFDADFIPNPDFLKRTIPIFEDAQIGVVQTRWEHLNEDYSLLTKLQAFQLNVHFTIEQ